MLSLGFITGTLLLVLASFVYNSPAMEKQLRLARLIATAVVVCVVGFLAYWGFDLHREPVTDGLVFGMLLFFLERQIRLAHFLLELLKEKT